MFALLNVVFLHAEVARQRREHRRRVEDEVASMREEARDFRLISTALSAESRVRTRDEEQEKLSQGSIETIHQQLYYTLDLLRTSLRLQTCALLWLDESGERLKVKELCTDSPHIVEGADPGRRRRARRDPQGAAAVRAGGAAARRCCRTTPGRPRWRRSSACRWSRGARRAASWSPIAPIGERLRRRRADAAGQRRRSRWCAIVQSERVFQAVERSKHEHERFYRASAALNRALTLDEVYDAAIAGARGVCEFDFAAIATYDARDGSHTIRRVVGEGGRELTGTTPQRSGVARVDGGEEQAGPARRRRAGATRDVAGASRTRCSIKGFESLLRAAAAR